MTNRWALKKKRELGGKKSWGGKRGCFTPVRKGRQFKVPRWIANLRKKAHTITSARGLLQRVPFLQIEEKKLRKGEVCSALLERGPAAFFYQCKKILLTGL